MEFLKRLLGKKSKPFSVDTVNNSKIKRASIIKDKKGKYHQVLAVLDGKVFFDDGYNWLATGDIIKYCKTPLLLKDVTLIEE